MRRFDLGQKPATAWRKQVWKGTVIPTLFILREQERGCGGESPADPEG